MTFQQLQYLLEVHNTKSISRAAANLFVSNSSISASVSNLEEELGFPIFSRSQKGLVPTAMGLRILEYAEQICKTYDKMNNVRDSKVTRLCYGFRDYPPISQAFARLVEENIHRKDIAFSCQSFLRDETINRIASGEMALSLITYFEPRVRVLENRLARRGLEHRILKTLPAAICVGPGHRLYEAKSIRPRELEDDIIVDNPSKPLILSDYLHGVMCFKPENTVLCSGNTAKALLHRGIAYTITIMPPDQKADDPLHYIPLEGVNYLLIQITNPEHPRAPETERFLELLDEELSKI